MKKKKEKRKRMNHLQISSSLRCLIKKTNYLSNFKHKINFKLEVNKVRKDKRPPLI